MEAMKVGGYQKLVVITYLDHIADKSLVAEVRERSAGLISMRFWKADISRN